MGISCSACNAVSSNQVKPLEEEPSQDVEKQAPPQDKDEWEVAISLDSLVQVVCGTTQVHIFEVEDSRLPGLAANANYIFGAGFSLMIFLLQYYVMLWLQNHRSLWNDPLTFVDTSQASFDASNEIHAQIALLQAEVRHPEESGYSSFALIFTGFMAVLLTRDVMTPVIIVLNVWMDFVRAEREDWAAVTAMAPALAMSAAVFVISLMVMISFGRTLAANEDVASILGDALGLYVCAELDNWVTELLNSMALPMKAYWTHDEMVSKVSKKGWLSAMIAACVFAVFGSTGIITWFHHAEG